ncbi:MAG: Ni/Fe hydrogenase subunit alpha [Chlamydiae bacterium]|nr:Ni/Fe hydrogenase subunit alpha [Chlamydiota bacterium]
MSNKDSDKEFKVKVGTKSRTIHVDYLARVEGEGSLYIKTKDNKVEDVKLKIFEPPRFFEALLRGRELFDAPDITARICGICPVAYQMSAVYAMENALGAILPEYLHQLRRLLFCGEWIESHTLHVYMLHAPDFLGYPDAIQMAKNYQNVLKRGLRIKKAGNEIIRLLGGREIHPINVKVGGFYQLPQKAQLLKLAEILKQARDDAQETVLWVSQFTFPLLEKPYECVALSHPDEYPIARGLITSTSGLKVKVEDFDLHFEESHVPHSTALHAKMKNKGSYLVGPMARYNLNQEQLSPIVKDMIKTIGFEAQCYNPFRSIIIRALEILYAFDEALRIIQEYDSEKQPASVSIEKRAATGYGATEAPRGLLYHRYDLNEQGLITNAIIVPPTSQNQKTIEEDLFQYVSNNLSMPDEELRWRCEQAIRNYDPCISCSAHFLKLERVHG